MWKKRHSVTVAERYAEAFISKLAHKLATVETKA